MENLQIYQFETATVEIDPHNSGKTPTLTLNRQKKQAKYFTIDLPNNLTIEMVSIPEGTFMMGSPEKEQGRSEDENPQHEVKISPFFYV